VFRRGKREGFAKRGVVKGLEGEWG